MSMTGVITSATRLNWLAPYSVCRVPCSTLRGAVAYQTRFSSNATRKRDEDIPFNTGRLVDPVTNQLGPSISIRNLLREIQNDKDRRKWQSVELVSEEPEPIIKLIDRRAAFRAEKEQRLRRRTARAEGKLSGDEVQEKEIQMTWGVATSDLHHKLKKAREALQQGHRISVVYAPKKGQSLPTPAEMKRKVEETMNALADVGQEWKKPEARNNTTVIYLKSNV